MLAPKLKFQQDVSVQNTLRIPTPSAFNQVVQGLGHKLTNITHDQKIGDNSPCNTSKIPCRNGTTGHDFNNLLEDP